MGSKLSHTSRECVLFFSSSFPVLSRSNVNLPWRVKSNSISHANRIGFSFPLFSLPLAFSPPYLFSVTCAVQAYTFLGSSVVRLPCPVPQQQLLWISCWRICLCINREILPWGLTLFLSIFPHRASSLHPSQCHPVPSLSVCGRVNVCCLHLQVSSSDHLCHSCLQREVGGYVDRSILVGCFGVFFGNNSKSIFQQRGPFSKAMQVPRSCL